MFPSDTILIARGKYSTLSKERKEHIKRMQGISTTMITAAAQILADCQNKPPTNLAAYESLGRCLENAINARDRISVLCDDLSKLEPLAWGDEPEQEAK